jgi:hypothetical protein
MHRSNAVKSAIQIRFAWRFCVLAILVLVAAAPLAAAQIPAGPLPARAAFANLKHNAPVAWLVRLAVYDPENPVLRIDDASSLGPAIEDFSFVADYAELRGHTASEAAHRVGIAWKPGQSVSGLIFPIGRHTIFPASVRGMLQVVQQIDMRRAAEPGYKAAPLDVLLTNTERANLAAVDIKSWAWANYRAHFLGFARAFATLRARNASAVAHIGEIGPAWSEPGCWRMLELVGTLERAGTANERKMVLDLPGGQTIQIQNFAVRAFLVRNQPVSSLPGRVLLDFSDPARQQLPLEAPAAK